MRLIRLLLLAFLALAGTAVQAQWRRAESPNFIVYGEGSEARLRERILMLEDFDRLLRIVTNVNAPPAGAKLHVYFVANNRELRQIRRVEHDVAGFYTASAEGVAAFVSQSNSSGNSAGNNEILFHEYAHHFMLQHAPGAYPAWYIEGFAEYFMTARFSPRAIDVGNFSRARVGWLGQGNWLPLDRVLGGTTQGMIGEAGAMYYAQAWLLTHYFYSNPERQAALARYLVRARASGPVEAIEAATGMDADRMERELRDYISGGTIRYRRMQRDSEAAAPAIRVTALPASANDLILHSAALRVGVPEARQPEALSSIRTLAARHPADAFARRTLAEAELLFGDRAAAARLLDALTTQAPGDAELMYLRGRLHLEAAEATETPQAWEAEARQARQWFVRAHNADANHFQTLYRYALALRKGPQATAENTANVLMLAHQLAPQVTEIRFAAANLLLQRDQFAEAEAVLRPLASDPHNRSTAAAARQLIERARNRQRGSDEEQSAPADEAAD